MKNILIILICLASIIILNLFAFIIPIVPSQVSLFVLGGIAILLYYKSTFPFSINIFILCFCTLLNLFLILTFDNASFTDGDDEGWGYLPIFLGEMSAIVFSIAFCIIYKKKVVELLIGLILSGTLIFFYQKYLGDYGQIISEPSCTEMKISKRNNLFVSELHFSDSIIIRKIDTFYIESGWIEKEIAIDHRKLTTKIIETGKYKIAIIINGKYHSSNSLKKIFCYIGEIHSEVQPLKRIIKSEDFPTELNKIDTISLYFCYKKNFDLKFINTIKAFPKTAIQ